VPNLECTYAELREFVMIDMVNHADCEHGFYIITDSEDLVILYYEWGEVGELLCPGGTLYFWKAS